MEHLIIAVLRANDPNNLRHHSIYCDCTKIIQSLKGSIKIEKIKKFSEHKLTKTNYQFCVSTLIFHLFIFFHTFIILIYINFNVTLKYIFILYNMHVRVVPTEDTVLHKYGLGEYIVLDRHSLSIQISITFIVLIV